MGLKQNHTNREICSLFTSLLEQRKLIKVDYAREEWVYTPFTNGDLPDCHQETKKINYPAFIFPNYYDHGPREAFTEEQIENLEFDAMYMGNDDKSNQQINAYFDKFLSLYEIHLVKKIPDDAYQKVIEQFLDELE